MGGQTANCKLQITDCLALIYCYLRGAFEIKKYAITKFNFIVIFSAIQCKWKFAEIKKL